MCEVGVIDYKAGNSPSVLNALSKLNIPARLVSSPGQIKNSKALILPGVGAAKATINSLKSTGIIDVLNERVNEAKIPFLGICVGLQILFEHSDEDDTECLGWIRGNVKKFSNEVRAPQMGWNKVEFKFDDRILDGLNSYEYFYFVNSYYAVPENDNITLGETDYDGNFCSMVKQDNIVATQFHLEKSGIIGLKLLKNFAKNAGVEIC